VLFRSQAQAYIAVALGIATLSGLMAGLVRHLVKYYLSELRQDGNGGHNLVGRVERIELRVDRIYEMLLEDRLSK
jgi:hypothetical protein